MNSSNKTIATQSVISITDDLLDKLKSGQSFVSGGNTVGFKDVINEAMELDQFKETVMHIVTAKTAIDRELAVDIFKGMISQAIWAVAVENTEIIMKAQNKTA